MLKMFHKATKQWRKRTHKHSANNKAETATTAATTVNVK